MVPHFAFPFRIDASGAAAVVDQDSAEDITQCVKVLFSTTVGERIEVPTYGIPMQAFATVASEDTSALAAAVKKWEPRATARISSNVVDERMRRVLVELEKNNELLAGRS